jgi:hypothetical protein
MSKNQLEMERKNALAHQQGRNPLAGQRQGKKARVSARLSEAREKALDYH